MKLERNADNFGQQFFLGGLKPWRNKAEKTSLEKVAEKFAGNFPKISTVCKLGAL